MNAILITLNVIVLLSLAAIGYQWPPALFAYLVVGPFALLSLWGVSKGEVSARTIFVTTAVVMLGGLAVAAFFRPNAVYGMIIVGPIVFLGCADMLQKKRAIRRNFPVIGHARYLLETIRPEIQQYFVESETDGMPVSREFRSLIYQRAKGDRDTRPFGTVFDVNADGYEWINHSLAPTTVDYRNLKISFGGPDCTQPYDAWPLNI